MLFAISCDGYTKETWETVNFEKTLEKSDKTINESLKGAHSFYIATGAIAMEQLYNQLHS